MSRVDAATGQHRRPHRQQPGGALQVTTFALCLLCLIMDGFDVQALGYVAPEIVRAWKIRNAALGPVFGAGNFGVLIGSLVFSMLADKIGRRPILIGATFFFGVLTIVAARATSVGELLALRFVGGIGLGCIIPNATALVGEYSPRRLRGPLMMIIGGVGFTGGAAIGGFIAAFLIPRFGWQSVLYFGGRGAAGDRAGDAGVAARVAAVSRGPAEGPRENRAVADAHRSDACRPVRTSSSSCARRTAKECRWCTSFARAAAR